MTRNILTQERERETLKTKLDTRMCHKTKDCYIREFDLQEIYKKTKQKELVSKVSESNN